MLRLVRFPLLSLALLLLFVCGVGGQERRRPAPVPPDLTSYATARAGWVAVRYRSAAPGTARVAADLAAQLDRAARAMAPRIPLAETAARLPVTVVL
ncbi:MAG TPA: hypothetical protein VHU81_16660, partial [Thermoanaerobaculia bacterium]|nr:hypothetical protein [Thermoanaerobaculia bacterium]